MSTNPKSFEDYLDWISSSWNLFGKPRRAKPRRLAPSIPGKVLSDEFLLKQGWSQTKLARKLGCTHAKVNEIISGKRRITVSFALQLEKVFAVDADYWLLLQMEYDLWQARQTR